MKAGVQKPWSVAATFEMCRTYLQMARHFVNAGSNHQLKGRFLPFGAEVKFCPISSKDQGRVHQFGTSPSWNIHALNVARSCTGDLLKCS